MNWNKVDLKSSYERSQNFLDGYSFETLLLEVHCNLKEITKETVLAQFEECLKIKVQSAREIVNANIENLVTKAKKERNRK